MGSGVKVIFNFQLVEENSEEFLRLEAKIKKLEGK
jgi:hypothetical protein